MKIGNKYRKFLKRFILFFFLVILLRLFFFDIYYIPSGSMENTIKEGDVIFVNKVLYGARLPENFAEIPFFSFLAAKRAHTDKPYIRHFYGRLFGFSKIQRNDIALFNDPLIYNQVLIKRCIGLPGDTIQILSNKTLINGKEITSPNTATFNYYFKLRKQDISRINDFFRRWQAYLPPIEPVFDLQALDMTESQANILASFTDTIYKEDAVNFANGKTNISVYHSIRTKEWNIYDLQRTIIPKKDDIIFLTVDNINKFRKIITQFEENTLKVDGNKIFINNQLVRSYRCKYDYYFFMGDNRTNAIDSRFFGPIPESYVIGKASYVIYNENLKARKFLRLD